MGYETDHEWNGTGVRYQPTTYDCDSCRAADPMKRPIRRFVRWIANRFGLMVVPPETLLEWTERATKHSLIAGDHDLNNPRLSGLHDGRAAAYNECAFMVRELNTQAQRPEG